MRHSSRLDSNEYLREGVCCVADDERGGNEHQRFSWGKNKPINRPRITRLNVVTDGMCERSR